MKISAKRVLLPDGELKDKTITVENGILTDIHSYEKGDIECAIAAPGLIDQHVHGGFGASLMHSNAEEILNWLRFLACNGVTQILGGIATAPVETMRKALALVQEVQFLQQHGAGGALLTGVHLEGPFISQEVPGAMDVDAILPPTIENYIAIIEGYEDLIKLITIAPDSENVQPLVDYLNGRHIRVEAGHTHASAECAKVAFANGFGCVTHFFNASTPIHHRAPGMLTEALLNDQVYTECICDFVHVHPSAVKLIYRCKGPERMIVISDAVFTTGLPDGLYEECGDIVVVKNGESRTLSGALDGGGMVQLQEVRNLISVGISDADAFRMASATPASYLGIKGGNLAIGQRAEILCMDENYNALATVIGEDIYQ